MKRLKWVEEVEVQEVVAATVCPIVVEVERA